MRPKEAGDADIAWTREYGNAVCIRGAFGVEFDVSIAVYEPHI